MNSPARFRPNGRHLALVGPTASGKSALALELARTRDDIELVTVDSMQVYRGMDIGTAKPSASEQAEVVHHLLDRCDPDEEYTVSLFQNDCLAVLAAIEARGNRAVLVGGTGLYLQSITDDLEIPGRFPELRIELEEELDTSVLYARLQDLDATAAAKMESTNRRRVIRALEVTLGSGRPFSTFGPGLEDYPPSPFPIFGLAMERDLLDERIAQRYQQQMASGFLEEVAALRGHPNGLSRTARQALGYSELLDHLENGTDLENALDEAKMRTRRFARRQQRWFGRDPRVTWIATGREESGNRLAELAHGLVD
ncbi:MAG: tRNA (adenosine(37)-N6)-dimethylallyltransferase MiaA [Acidimicrobiales bacterium]